MWLADGVLATLVAIGRVEMCGSNRAWSSTYLKEHQCLEFAGDVDCTPSVRFLWKLLCCGKPTS
eukprot:38613-Chlamydomonas_euryale.AAC.6